MGVTSRWINPNAVPLTQDRFSDNGTFSAANEGKYGYNKVSVGVETDRIFGKDPDTDEDVEVREKPEPKDPYRPDEGGGDDGGGEKLPHLVKTVLPSQIAVIRPPDRTAYLMGETIDYTGIGVQARLKSGRAWDGFPGGMVPFEELIFPHARVEDFPDCREVAASEILYRGKLSNSGLLARGIDPSFEEYYADGVAEQAEEVVNRFTYWLRYYEKLGYNIAVRRATKFYVADTMDHYSSAGIWDGIWEALDDDDFARYNTFILGGAVFPAWIYFNYPYKETLYAQFAIRATIAFDAFETPQFRITKLELKSPTRYTKHIFQGVEKTGSLYTDTRLTNHVICSLDDFVSNINVYIPPDVDAATVGENDIPIYLATSELDCGITQPIRFSTRGVAVCAPETEGESRHRETHFSGWRIALAPRDNQICYITASAGVGSMDIVDKWIDEDAGGESEESETVYTNSRFTYDGRTVYYARGCVAMDGAIESCLPDTASDGAALLQHAGEIAWTMVYGDVLGTDKALPVQWARPGDGQVLETTFNIRVATPVE